MHQTANVMMFSIICMLSPKSLFRGRDRGARMAYLIEGKGVAEVFLLTTIFNLRNLASVLFTICEVGYSTE